MKIQEIVSPYEIYTGKVVISRHIPYFTDGNSPPKLLASLSAMVESNLSIPGKETGIKILLGLQNTLVLTHKFTVEVHNDQDEERQSFFSAYSEVVQIFTYQPAYYQEIADNHSLMREFIMDSALLTAWTYWRAQVGASIAACSLPVPYIPPVPPEAILEQYRPPT